MKNFHKIEQSSSGFKIKSTSTLSKNTKKALKIAQNPCFLLFGTENISFLYHKEQKLRSKIENLLKNAKCNRLILGFRGGS